MATWVLTGGIENFRINVERGFDVIGFKERRRNQALEFEPGDEIVFYVTKYADDAGRPAGQALGAIARVTSGMFEDRTPIWPGFKAGRRRRGPHAARKNGAEEYPWRVEAEPVLVLAESEFVAVESLLDELEHVRRWPAEHWHLAFQGQLRTISDDDAALVRGRMQAAAGTPATSA